jgi:hypothetical protein
VFPEIADADKFRYNLGETARTPTLHALAQHTETTTLVLSERQTNRADLRQPAGCISHRTRGGPCVSITSHSYIWHHGCRWIPPHGNNHHPSNSGNS